MTSNHGKVAEHYTFHDLGQRLLSALEAAGKNLTELKVDDLAPVDEFHIRGRTATEELATWAQVGPESKLLDVGCGLGGTSRYLAANFSCAVTGLDLTEEYCRVAEMLSARVGMSEQTSFRQGNALELPFPEGHFDTVWTEHVQMNIADKNAFYQEQTRVLKPGGEFVFHDIFAGDKQDLHFPVPWAAEPSISHLIPVQDLQALLTDLGLAPVRWEEKTQESIAFFQAAVERAKNEEGLPLGLHLVMGEQAGVKFGNMLRNLKEGRLCVVQAVMKKVL